jgi:hypothetical protein
MPKSDPSIVMIDLAEAGSESELATLLATKLALDVVCPTDWEQYARALASSALPSQRLVLRGLAALEARLPNGAQSMMRAFAEYNAHHGDRPLLVAVDNDYAPSVFLLQFRADRSETAAAGEATRAYVTCWIKRNTPDAAESAARASIEGSGWRVTTRDECRRITRSDYSAGAPDLEFFSQALVDGEVCVFDSW